MVETGNGGALSANQASSEHRPGEKPSDPNITTSMLRFNQAMQLQD